MSLTRKVIRENFAKALSQIEGVKVYSGRFQPTDASELPFVRICSLNESGSLALDDSFRRTLDLSILIYQTGDEHLDDDLDDLSEKVEQIVLANPMRGEIQQVDFESMRLDASSLANLEVGVTELMFKVTYDWHLNIDPTPLCAISGEIAASGTEIQFEEKLNE